MWATAYEFIGSPVTISDPFASVEDGAGPITFSYAGSVRVGNPSGLSFGLIAIGKSEPGLEQFKILAAEAGAEIVSPKWLKRLNVIAFDSPVSLWLAFLLRFGSPEQRDGYRILPNLHAQSILAIERAIQMAEAASPLNSVAILNTGTALPDPATLADIWAAYPEIEESRKGRVQRNLSNRSRHLPKAKKQKDIGKRMVNTYPAQLVREVIAKEKEMHTE